jgi:hypothetical protein
MTDTKIGPNVKRLLILKMSRNAIPDGGGLADGIKFLSSKESIMSGYKAAEEWTEAVIQAVRDACDPNPFRKADNETIATEIVRRIDAARVKVNNHDHE